MTNDEVIRALFEAFSTRDVDSALRLVTEDIEFWPKIIMVIAGRDEPYRGHDGIRAYYDDLAKHFEKVEIEVESIRTVAGGAAVFGTSRGTLAGGAPFEVPLLIFARFSDGLVMHARSIASVDELDG